MTQNQIKHKISSNLDSLKDTYPIKSIGIFGSVARGEQHLDSDVDVLVEFSRPIGIFDFIRLEDRLSQLTDRKVDLVTKKGLKPAIKEEVLRQTIYV